MFATFVKCPVCGELFDVIRHGEPICNSQGLAMCAGEGRREHAAKSPECTRDTKWFEGWHTETVDCGNPLNRGETVRYIPKHANGNALHKDCETGKVTFVNSQYVFVRFKPNESAKACRPEDLVRWIG